MTGLAKGTYEVCFKVVGQDGYEQCFEVVVGEPKPLSAFICLLYTSPSPRDTA